MGLAPGEDAAWDRLTAGCRRRDRACFAELVRQTEPRLRRLLGRLARSGSDVDDLLQETYLRAWNRVADFRGESSLTTWLTRIALNVAANARRGRRPATGLPDEAIDRRASGPTPPDETLQAVYAEALDALPDELRVPFVLHETEGRSYAEIAALLEWPTGTVMSRLHRARQTLLAQVRERLEVFLP
jgi:RNA polymerase sigma-70 factor (ECF subfamily)